MKRSTLLAGLLTIGVHAVALGCLSFWRVGGGDVALATLPEPEAAPPASPVVSPARDTVALPVVLPERGLAAGDSAVSVRSAEAPRVGAKPAARKEVTPILMLSWQKGGGRRKTSGALPTLTGPLAGDVSASFKVMVAPDGKVRSVRPVKGKNAAFEKAAMARIKQWKFEPLRASRPSDQLCMVTLKAKAR